METNVNFKYYAFISYSHEDEEFAKRIQKKLTEYKLPSVIRKANPLLPDNVRPIFRDATNLTTGMLQGTLNSELEHSKFLIVLCSPNSAKPNDENKHWVNKEVQHFIDLERTEYIIPVIVGGEPYAENPEEECFCPALLSLPGGDELLGIDIRKGNNKKLDFYKSIKRKLGIPDEDDFEEKGFVHIVAKMMGLDIDDLWDWNKKAQKRKSYSRLFSAAAVFVIMLSIGLSVYFKKFHVYHKYYVDYVEKAVQRNNGTDIEFIGLGRLSQKEIRCRYRHYRFDYQDGKLRKIIYENSVGIPRPSETEFMYRPMIQELEYDKTTGNFQAILAKNEYDSIIAKYIYEQNGSVVDIKNIDGTPKGFISESSMKNAEDFIRDVSNIKSYKLQRDFNGYLIKKMYFKSFGAENPSYDSDGIAGFEYKLDNLGRPIEILYLGIKKISLSNNEDNFSLQNAHNGVAGLRIEYNDYLMSKVIYINSEGIPIYNSNKGYSMISIEYDNNGNSFRELYFDEKGIPCYNADCYVSNQYRYDKKGNRIEISYFGMDNNLICNKNYYAYEKSLFDSRGNLSQRFFYNTKNELCATKWNFSKIKYKYNSKNMITEEKFYDANDKPIMTDEGYAKIVFEYNKNGDKESECYYDEMGNPSFWEGGNAKTYRIYDNNHRLIKWNSYDIDLSTLKESKNGWASVLFEYDRLGNCKKIKGFDEEMKPKKNIKDICSISYNYDDFGRLVEGFFFDEYGKLTNCSDGYAGFGVEYDEFGFISSESFYKDLEKNLIKTNFGYSFIEYEYDDKGNEKIQKRYNSEMKPVKPFILQIDYDDNNNIICNSFFDENHKYVKCKDNYAMHCIAYNKQGEILEQKFFDEFMQLTIGNGSFAIINNEYDKDKNIIRQIQYDEKNEIKYFCKMNYDKNRKLSYELIETKDGIFYESFYEDGKLVHQIGKSTEDETTEEFYENDKIIHSITNSLNGYTFENFYENEEIVHFISTFDDGIKNELFYENNQLVHSIHESNIGKIEEFFDNEELIREIRNTAEGELYENVYKNNSLVYTKNINIMGDTFEKYYNNEELDNFSITYSNENKYESFYKNLKMVSDKWIPAYNKSKNKILIFLHNHLPIMNGRIKNVAFNCTLSLKNGEINGLCCSDDREKIKTTLPFYTGESFSKDSNYGGGIFYTNLDVYFYTNIDVLNVREDYPAKIDIPIFEMTFDEIKLQFGNAYNIIETKIFDVLYEFKQSYGYLYLLEENNKCTELYITKRPIYEIEIEYEDNLQKL